MSRQVNLSSEDQRRGLGLKIHIRSLLACRWYSKLWYWLDKLTVGVSIEKEGNSCEGRDCSTLGSEVRKRGSQKEAEKHCHWERSWSTWYFLSSHLKNIFQGEGNQLCHVLMWDEGKCISDFGNMEVTGDLENSIFNSMCCYHNSYYIPTMPWLW